MEALTIIEGISLVNLDRCISCGICVSTCPEEAIKLREKEKEFILPKDSSVLYLKIMIKNRESGEGSKQH
ncbi:MAG: 4Fe-4S binding protein [Candidatus Hodarchaeota archaeon]